MELVVTHPPAQCLLIACEHTSTQGPLPLTPSPAHCLRAHKRTGPPAPHTLTRSLPASTQAHKEAHRANVSADGQRAQLQQEREEVRAPPCPCSNAGLLPARLTTHGPSLSRSFPSGDVPACRQSAARSFQVPVLPVLCD